MKKFPSPTTFKYPRRDYQARVLEELEKHLDDTHLHIVAAPWSGKTVLGLEVLLRINKPTLVLAPSIAIRNQRIERLTELFLQVDTTPKRISTDIKKPEFLTVSTYQWLHSALKTPVETDNNLSHLKHISTLVIDEAHHLRNERRKSLIKLKDSIENPFVVALTATPPYDVSGNERRRYQNLCGPIDAEISVPELVNKKNLCPHQDFVFFNTLNKHEQKIVSAYRKNIENFIKQLTQDEELYTSLINHPHITESYNYMEPILDNPEYYSSIVIFSKQVWNIDIKQLRTLLGIHRRRIPHLSYDWLETFLENLLYKDDYLDDNYKELKDNIKKDLKTIWALERRNVIFFKDRELKKTITTSINKLESIQKIVQHEHNNLSEKLRMVILTDYIQKEFLPKDKDDQPKINQFWVIPIFEHLRKSNKIWPETKLWVLTWSLVLIPSWAKPALKTIAHDLEITEDHIRFATCKHDTNYTLIRFSWENNKKIVAAITALFSQGEIHVLVGTKSLLGEGRDAPCINSLILASYVGSFMLSNQMRGRAIRIDPNEPNKSANIWHLVSLDPTDDDYGLDYRTLKRRFEAFVGVALNGKSIESGLERINALDITPDTFQDANTQTLALSSQRENIPKLREQALRSWIVMKLTPQIRTPRELLPRKFVFANTIETISWTGLGRWGHILMQGIKSAPREASGKIYAYYFSILFFLAGGIASLFLIKALRLFVKNGPVSGNIQQIGEILLDALCEFRYIKTDKTKLKVTTINKNKWHWAYGCFLQWGSLYEQNLFLDMMEETLAPIENPRYIIVRKSLLWWILRRDYHTIPSLFATQKRKAEYFSKKRSSNVGRNKLIYTRTGRWRRELLKARQHSLSSKFAHYSKRKSIWQ